MPATTVTSAPRSALAAAGACGPSTGGLSAAPPRAAKARTQSRPPTHRWQRGVACWRSARPPETKVVSVVDWQLPGLRIIERCVLTPPGRRMQTESIGLQACPGGDSAKYPGNAGSVDRSPRSKIVVPCHSSRGVPGTVRCARSVIGVGRAVFDALGSAHRPPGPGATPARCCR